MNGSEGGMKRELCMGQYTWGSFYPGDRRVEGWESGRARKQIFSANRYF